MLLDVTEFPYWTEFILNHFADYGYANDEHFSDLGVVYFL